MRLSLVPPQALLLAVGKEPYPSPLAPNRLPQATVIASSRYTS